MIRFLFPCGLIAMLQFGCCRIPDTSQPPLNKDEIAINEVVARLDDYELVTAKPVATNPELSKRCTGVSVEQLKRAEKKHGPHAYARISISMSPQATQAFERGADRYPEGAVIIKSKSLGWVWGGSGRRSLPYVASEPGAPNDGVGGMIKRHAGYAPQSGDWEYFYFEKKDEIEHGLIQSCVQCHQKAQSSDFVFGTWDQPADDGY